MFNFKTSGIAAGAAFAVSLLLGLASGAGFPALLFRAVGFGGFFFLLFCVIFWLLGQFIPELLSGSGDLFDAPGSRVNLSVGSGPIEGAFPSEDTDEVDSINGGMARVSPGQLPVQPDEDADSSVSAGKALDQNDEEGYNKKEFVSAGEASGRPAGETAGKGGRNSGEVDLIPDFDTLSEAFLPDSGPESPETAAFDIPEQKKAGSRVSSNQGFGGDFNPKELAQAIRTVLKKEEKG
ncbi:MAG: hypothetical protein LBP69_08495 [Treponema sp.]|jgi:hypothetical protein|nr:hypothetical protein [Treponema sp.]